MADFRVDGGLSEIFSAKAVLGYSKGNALKFAAGGVTPAGDGDTVDGIALETVTINNFGNVARGPIKVTGRAAAAVNFSVGDDVYLDAAGALDTGTAGDVSMGKVIGDDPEVAGWVQFKYDHLGSFTHA